jgi:hypothetical protein
MTLTIVPEILIPQQYFMLQITINASARFYSGRYATGNIPTNHPCLATFYDYDFAGGITFSIFFKLAFPPLILTSLVTQTSNNSKFRCCVNEN